MQIECPLFMMFRLLDCVVSKAAVIWSVVCCKTLALILICTKLWRYRLACKIRWPRSNRFPVVHAVKAQLSNIRQRWMGRIIAYNQRDVTRLDSYLSHNSIVCIHSKMFVGVISHSTRGLVCALNERRLRREPAHPCSLERAFASHKHKERMKLKIKKESNR